MNARTLGLPARPSTFFADSFGVRAEPVRHEIELDLGASCIGVSSSEPHEAARPKSTSFGDLVGIAPSMRELFAILERLAPGDLAVLIEGAAGTGKETIARALAAAGPRRTGSFEVIDCAALPHHFAAGTLFDPSGVLAASSGGTLFLEDVSELPLSIQSTLARALKGQRPGATRLLSTSRVDLRTMVNRGAFREDLYDAIAQARVRVPSLSERTDDMKPLVLHFLAKIPSETHGARSIDPAALDAIVAQSFPANVRELRSFVERAAKIALHATITVADVDLANLLGAARGRGERAEPAPASPTPETSQEPLEGFKEAKRTLVDEFERAYLVKLLARTGKNISRASAVAGIERQSLRDLLRRHGLTVES
jgi:DNA-binding NtrC family response regulator